MRSAPCLLLLALVAALSGPAAAHMTKCQAACLSEPWQPVCGRHTFGKQALYWVYGNACEVACANQDDPSSPVVLTEAHLRLPASCKASWEGQWGTLGNECVCGPATATAGDAVEEAPRRRALQAHHRLGADLEREAKEAEAGAARVERGLAKDAKKAGHRHLRLA